MVIGSGNVAEAYARLLPRVEGVELVQLFARNSERGIELATLSNAEWCCDELLLASADLYIIAVSDRAIAEVAERLPFAREAIVVHTAGSVPLSAIVGREGHRGILYAFQSFTAGRNIDFSSIPIFIEADNAAVEARIRSFAERLSTRVYHADSKLRRTIHLAGVVVNNFVNHLYALGGDIVAREGLDFGVLVPLIEETARKAIESGNPHGVQTGPAVRADRAVCDKHIEMLADRPELQRIYNEITDSIWETSKRI